MKHSEWLRGFGFVWEDPRQKKQLDEVADHIDSLEFKLHEAANEIEERRQEGQRRCACAFEEQTSDGITRSVNVVECFVHSQQRIVLEGRLDEALKANAWCLSRLETYESRIRGLFLSLRQYEGMTRGEAFKAWEDHGKRNLIDAVEKRTP